MNFQHRITIVSDTSTASELDATYGTFLADVPCNVVPVNGGERYRGVQLQAETNIVIETRYYDGILPNMRATNGSSTYLFKKVIKRHGRTRFLLIEATEVVV